MNTVLNGLLVVFNPRQGWQRIAEDRPGLVTQLLLHFQRDLSVVHRQGVKHLGHGVTRELHVDDSADDLND